MIVAVQRGMTEIKERLEQSGYRVVYADEYDHPVDALIFSGRDNAMPHFSFYTPEMVSANIPVIPGARGISHGSRHSGGAIEINATGRSFEQIEEMLIKNRSHDYFY